MSDNTRELRHQSTESILANSSILEIVHPNMAELSRTDKAMFAMTRRSGLGASDASVILGVNKWTSIEALIEEKTSIGLTESELAVGEKEVVRKGADLEPIILGKFQDAMGVEVVKLNPMFRIKEHPQLTINFDGVINLNNTLIPVEAKFCSMFANKWWNRQKTIARLQDGVEYRVAGGDIVSHIEQAAELYGIPPYYYTQVQQQMLGLDAPFGYFAVVFDKGWEFGAYCIYKDEWVQRELIAQSAEVWKQITHKRGERSGI